MMKTGLRQQVREVQTRSVACRDCDEKVTVLVMGIILYAALFSDVHWGFLFGEHGTHIRQEGG